MHDVRRMPIWIGLLYLVCMSTLVFAQSETAAPAPAPTENASTNQAVQEIELICPMDGNRVKGYEIKAFASSGTDRDFCQLHAGRSLYDLWITCCPDSGYCGYKDDFGIALSPDIRQKIQTLIKPNYDLDNLGPWDRYEITAQIYQWRSKPEIDIANAYLRGTYTFRAKAIGPEMRAKEKQMRQLAIGFFRKVEKKGQFELKEMSTAKYLIGELYRRNEKYNKAVRYFEDSLKIKNRPDWLEKWVIQQMAKANAEYAD